MTKWQQDEVFVTYAVSISAADVPPAASPKSKPSKNI